MEQEPQQPTKYLSDYIEQTQTDLFDELGVFFAFSNEQFSEGRQRHSDKLQGGKWASLGAGMFMPSANVDTFIERHSQIVKDGIRRDLEENGRDGVLRRELANYEIVYAYDGLDDPNFRAGIKGYDFTEEEIRVAYRKYLEEVEA